MREADPEISEQIELSVREALARFGAAGEVRVSGDAVVLHGSGPTVSTVLGRLPEQWPLLPVDERQRHGLQIARRLVHQRRGTSPSQAPASGIRRALRPIAPLGVLGLTAIALWQAHRFYRATFLTPAPPAPSSVTAAADEDAARQRRAEAVCQRTRVRVMQGATVGPADVEGWVVELSLIGPAAARVGRSPALARFFVTLPEGGHRVSGSSGLAAVTGPTTRVVLEPKPLPGGLEQLRATFTGRYVDPYFRAERRSEFVRLSAELATAVGATHGALYARCAEDDAPHIGSWFYGPGPAGAAASLMFAMGVSADVPHFGAALLEPRPEEPAADLLRRIEQAAAPLDRERVAVLIGADGGSIAGRPEGPTTLAVDFADANRASRISLRLARALGIAADSGAQ